MARAKFIDDPDFELLISRASAHTGEVAEAALRAGASVIADQMKRNLAGILSVNATGQLIDSFGITPVKQDKDFNYNVHLGFDGYQKPGYGKFRATGVPFQLIARSFESGAVRGGRYRDADGNATRSKKRMVKVGSGDYWRVPTPFARPAVQATKLRRDGAMILAAEKELQRLEK